MKTYHNLLFEKLNINRKIKEEKKRLHKEFVMINKRTFLYLDLALILMLLFNFGAVTITNALVVKKEPTIQVFEMNPVAVEVGGYEAHDDSGSFVRQLMMVVIAWIILLSSYVYYRRNIFTEEGFMFLIIMTLLFFIVLGGDFFNDLGYWIGNLIY